MTMDPSQNKEAGTEKALENGGRLDQGVKERKMEESREAREKDISNTSIHSAHVEQMRVNEK